MFQLRLVFSGTVSENRTEQQSLTVCVEASLIVKSVRWGEGGYFLFVCFFVLFFCVKFDSITAEENVPQLEAPSCQLGLVSTTIPSHCFLTIRITICMYKNDVKAYNAGSNTALKSPLRSRTFR